MKRLSNEQLLETYLEALEVKLDEAFIQMLSQEMDRRGIPYPKDRLGDA